MITDALKAKRYEGFTPMFECIAGSQLYGTASPESDVDCRGVFIASRKYFLGFSGIEQIEPSAETVYFEIRKFLRLCLECNPNLIELLFVPRSMQIYSSRRWQRLLKAKNIFLSRKAARTFPGYAMAQLHRIKQHRNWLLHPMAKQPVRSDFGLPMEKTLVTKDQLNAYEELKGSVSVPFELNPNFLGLLEREKAFLNANRDWNNYETWLRQRNVKRAALEKRSGYDTKHASHLIRLISEGRELLLTGQITFPRPDAELLRAIIDGEYSYEQLMSMIGDLDTVFREITVQSLLPEYPDQELAEELCQSLVFNAISR
jgi:predicted nucleotidyltransferase